MQLWPLTVACENNDVDPHRAIAPLRFRWPKGGDILCLGMGKSTGWTGVSKKVLKGLPSGKHRKSYGKWPIEFVDLLNLKVVIFNCYICKRLPKGNLLNGQTASFIYSFEQELPFGNFSDLTGCPQWSQWPLWLEWQWAASRCYAAILWASESLEGTNFFSPWAHSPGRRSVITKHYKTKASPKFVRSVVRNLW